MRPASLIRVFTLFALLLGGCAKGKVEPPDVKFPELEEFNLEMAPGALATLVEGAHSVLHPGVSTLNKR